MNIENPTQFSNFIRENDLSSLDPLFEHTMTCMDRYIASCNCAGGKNNPAYDRCKKLYISAATKAKQTYKNEFLKKTNDQQIVIYIDKTLITTIRR